MRRSTTDRSRRTAAVAALIVASLTAVGCSSDAGNPAPATPPITCTVLYGDLQPRELGPIRRGDYVLVSISEDSHVRIGNSPTAIHLEVVRGPSERRVTVEHDDIPASGYVLEDVWIDSDHPGYEITCRR